MLRQVEEGHLKSIEAAPPSPSGSAVPGALHSATAAIPIGEWQSDADVEVLVGIRAVQQVHPAVSRVASCRWYQNAACRFYP